MTNSKTCGNGFASGLTYFLIGGGIGAVVALLFAPKSGNQLRGEIADVSRRGYDATLEKANDLKRQSAEVVQTVKDRAEVAFDFAAGKLASGKEAIEDAVSAGMGAFEEGAEQMGNGRKASN